MSTYPILAAVSRGDTKQLKSLIKRGADVNEKVFNSDVEATPLAFALGLENAAMVKILIKAGADVNMKVKNGENHITHLEAAILSGKVELVKEIVHAGADVNEGIYYFGIEQPPLGVALQLGSHGILKLESESAAIVKVLIKAGADVNEKIYLQEGVFAHPLDVIMMLKGALKSKISLIKFFIENGANPGLKSHEDMTAIDLAELLGNKDLVHLLEEAERSFESQDALVEEEYYTLKDVTVESPEVYLAGDEEEVLFIAE